MWRGIVKAASNLFSPLSGSTMGSLRTQSTQELPGVDLYFLKKGQEDIEKISLNVTNFQSHIQRNKANYSFAQIEKDRFFQLDYKTILNDDQFLTDWPDFKQDLIGSTEFTLHCLGLAMHQLVIKLHHEKQTEQGIVKQVPVIRARIFNFEPVQQLKEVNVSCFGRFVSLRGTVVKASAVKIMCPYMAFYCPSCQSTHIVQQNNGVYTPLEKCQTPGCRAKGNFEALYDSSLTKTIDWQDIVIQEIDCDMARIPQTLECELTEDLVKSCLPGDDITISGIIKVRDPNENKGKNKQHSVFNLYLDTVSVSNNKNEGGGGYSTSYERITFTPEDYQAIKQIHAQPNLFRYLVHSLCPTIYGHEVVKAGLLLALFRGTKSNISRSESHVLMVGDPGLGKSQMLKSCSNVSPRGVYVCGNGSTTSGLTVTMTRESGGEYSLEAGALMLADQGCCCIDEFDKMPAQHACLLEAMEQQSISIAKAGVVCSLPTKPTILVAANPAGGHYNKAKTVTENLKMGSPMLSRFDLIFILLDQPNEHLDKYLTKHILTAHSSKKRRCTPKEFEVEELDDSNVGVRHLRDRLKLNGESIDFLPHKIFRKYIAYAQKYVNPQLSDGAKGILKECYVSLRKQFATGDCTPVTARQLHSLIRLTQARAKVELREEATEDDAKDVIEIMNHSLVDVFTNEAGFLDTSRSQMGTGMSYKNQVMKLLDILQRKSEIESKSVFSLQEIKEASETAGILKTKFSNALQSLNIQGFLLSKGRNTYQLNSAYL